jgi:hypothetical protein
MQRKSGQFRVIQGNDTDRDAIDQLFDEGLANRASLRARIRLV